MKTGTTHGTHSQSECSLKIRGFKSGSQNDAGQSKDLLFVV